MTNVAILGASNSIVGGGWHNRLGRSDVTVKCFAVGGSNSGIGIYKLLKESVLNWADIVIINFGVTEHEELKYKFIHNDHLYELISSLYKIISASGLPLISLSLPIIAGIDDIKNDVSYQIHKQCAYESHTLFIDGYKFTRDIIRKTNNLPTSFFFLDQHHLAPWVARHIGMAVSEIISELLKTPKNTPKRYRITKFDILDAERIAQSNNLNTVIRSTSLLSENTAILKNDDTIKFSDTVTIHGIYIDCGISSVKLSIKTPNYNIVKNYFCASRKAKKDSVQFKFCTFYKPVKLDKHSTISIAAADAITNEKNRMERDILDSNGSAYICGLLLSNGKIDMDCLVRNTSVLTNLIESKLTIRANDCAEICKAKYIDSGLKDLITVCESSHAKIGDYIYYLRDMFFKIGLDKASNNLTTLIKDKSIESHFKTDYQVITDSGYFDSEFYLKKYPDVYNAGIDPLLHFINHGCAEGRIPSNKPNNYTSKNISEIINHLRSNM